MPIIVSPPSTSDLIATAEDLDLDLDLDLSVEDATAADDQIALYQAELEALLGRSITNRTHVESGTWPLSGDRFYASGGPITAVTSITIAGSAVNAADFIVHRDSIEVSTWLATPGAIVVTYVGGWDAPRNLPARSAIIARTRRWLNRRSDDDEGVEQSSVEGHSVKWEADAFTEAELEACSRLRSPDLAG